MITIKKTKRKVNCFLMIFILAMSCNSIKNISKEKIEKIDNCYLSNEISSSLPENISSVKNNVIKEFQNSEYEFQVLWVNTVQGYDYKESHILFYIDNDKLYMNNGVEKKHMSSVSLKVFNQQLNKIRKKSFILTCQENSSSKNFNVFYFKEKNKESYTYNFRGKKIDEINRDLLINEIEFIRSLEGANDSHSN